MRSHYSYLPFLFLLTACGSAVALDDVVPFDSRWEFSDEVTADVSGEETTLPPSVRAMSRTWISIPDANQPPRAPNSRCSWFRTTTPDTREMSEPVLFINLSNAARVYVDGKTSYRFGDMASKDAPGWRGAFVPLPSRTAVVHVQLCTVTNYLGFHSSRIGRKSSVYKDIYLEDQPRLTFGGFFVLLGAGVFVLFLLDRRSTYLAFALTATIAGLHFVGHAHNLARLYFADDHIWAYLLYLGTFYLPAGILFFIETTVGMDRWRLVRILEAAHILYGTVAFLLFAGGIVPIEHTNDGAHGLILLSFATQLPRLGLHAWRGNLEARILTAGLVLFALAGLHDVVFARASGKITGGIVHFGALAFLSCIGLILIRHLEDTSSRLRRYSEDLEGLVAERTRTLQQTLDHLKRDLSIARSIQLKTLPEIPPVIQGVRIRTVFMPMAEVGGDLYDLCELPDGRIRLFLIDATGHGIQAALLTMAIKTEYESMKTSAASPATILGALNREFTRKYSHVNALFSAIIADVSVRHNCIHYASAGHPDQLTISPEGSVRILSRTGGILGMRESMEIDTGTIPFLPGDRLLLFSDGLFEEFNASVEQYDEERLRSSVLRHRHLPLEVFIDSVIQDLQTFLAGHPIQDDITIFALERPIPREEIC